MINVDPKEIERNGYTVVRGVLTPDEVETLRKTVSKHLSQTFVRLGPARIQPNAAVEVDELAWLFTHPKIIEVARKTMGDDAVFTSHCDAHLNVGSNWHKDSGDELKEGNYFRTDPYTTPGCQVYKFAFYLQDHENDDGSLRVSDGSHTSPSRKPEHPRVLHPKIGDMIVFDVRLLHAGENLSDYQKFSNRVFAKGGTTGAELAHLQRRLLLKLQNRKDRYTLFFTYGANNQYTREFAIRSMERQISQYPARSTKLSPRLSQALKTAGMGTFENDPAWPRVNAPAAAAA